MSSIVSDTTDTNPFIIPDIDAAIINSFNLPEIAHMRYVNKYFNEIILKNPVISEWQGIKSANGTGSTNNIDTNNIDNTNDNSPNNMSVRQYLVHIQWLINNRKINIHVNNEQLFRFGCKNGYLAITKWLIYLGEADGEKINIHCNHEEAFIESCKNGHFELAKWLIYLGENGYGRLNISRYIDQIYKYFVLNNQHEMARWMLHLSQCSYGKIYCV